MNIQLSLAPLAEIECDALVIPVFEGQLPKTLHPWIAELESSGEFSGKTCELSIIPQPAGMKAKRLVLSGAGKEEKLTAFEERCVFGAPVRALKSKGLKTVAISTGPGHVSVAAEAALTSTWEPDRYKSKKEPGKTIETVILAVPGGEPSLEGPLRKGIALGEAQNLARDLANQPGNLLPPRVLAERARAMADANGLECEILDEARMREMGFGSLLGVAQGSSEPPVLIVLRYRPASPLPNAHLALIGKGVTFDTGGISIKPSEGMEKMKYDMSGGAAVIGAMQAIAQLKPALTVTAFIPSVENMPGSNAQRPGDIVTSLAGKTVEVLNTDAEGRLILIDAMTYAKQQGCTHMVDAATLTGAIAVALGLVRAGAFANDQPLLDRVLSSAKAQGEKMWTMPMDDEYKEMLKSPYADMPNISGGRYGGAITAAKFLEEWTEGTPWVHLDIANVAWLDDGKPHISKGPSGFGVRTFVDLACRWSG
jgi:leucyl aminopeptidase